MISVDVPACSIALGTIACVVACSSSPNRAAWFALAVALAGWLTEESLIEFYGAYRYSSTWRIWLHEVPLAVVLGWPAVILTAVALSGRLCARDSLKAALTGAIVVLDASLIEPISVAAGLWKWNLSGVCDVPPCGVLGWGIFGCVMACVINVIEQTRASSVWAVVSVPCVTAFMLIVLPVVAMIVPPSVDWSLWIVLPNALVVGAIPFRKHPDSAALSAELRDLCVRVPAACFFFALFAGQKPLLLSHAVLVGVVSAPSVILCVRLLCALRSVALRTHLTTPEPVVTAGRRNSESIRDANRAVQW